LVGRVLGIDALDEAIVEIEHEAHYYLSNGGPAIRDAFLDDLTRTLSRIVDTPQSFATWPKRPGVRRALLDRFPFAVGYVVDAASDEPPLVVAVAHCRRRPGYWKKRRRRRPR
jgi:plasmid stabilization system protein ParE